MTTAARTTSRLTNKHGLPEPLVRAITYSDYDKEGCHYSITELLRPPRMVQLERIHAHEVVKDASDRIWLLLGSAGHEVLRRSADTSRIVEERAIVEIDGLKVGGQLDYSESDRSIWDYKFTSVYAVKEGPREEWIQQLNCYRWLANHYGVHINNLQIVAILRDWSKLRAAREPDYPQAQVRVFDIPVWPFDTTESFLVERIKAHEAAKVTLPECTAEETWERPEVFAVKKIGAKRALKLCASILEAEDRRGGSPDIAIEHRPAERPRCEGYCRVAPFCSQLQQFKQQTQ